MQPQAINRPRSIGAAQPGQSPQLGMNMEKLGIRPDPRSAGTGLSNIINERPAPPSINGLGSRFARAMATKPMKKGGAVKTSSASKRADGCAIKGKTKGKMV